GSRGLRATRRHGRDFRGEARRGHGAERGAGGAPAAVVGQDLRRALAGAERRCCRAPTRAARRARAVGRARAVVGGDRSRHARPRRAADRGGAHGDGARLRVGVRRDGEARVTRARWLAGALVVGACASAAPAPPEAPSPPAPAAAPSAPAPAAPPGAPAPGMVEAPPRADPPPRAGGSTPGSSLSPASASGGPAPQAPSGASPQAATGGGAQSTSGAVRGGLARGDGSPADAALLEGDRAWDVGDLTRARRAYSRAQKLAPRDPAPRVGLVRVGLDDTGIPTSYA